MRIVQKDAKRNAPPHGKLAHLKAVSCLKANASKLNAKKVYRVVFDDKMNDVFQKKNAQGEVTGYYPVSQEYGFLLKTEAMCQGLGLSITH